MNICYDFVFRNENKINHFNRSNFEKLLGTALQNSFSGFVDKSYKKIDVVTTGLPSGRSLAIHFCIFISKYDSMNVLKNWSLYITEDMLVIYMGYFIRQIVLKDFQTI